MTGSTSRVDALMRIEREIGVTIRRVRRVIGERARVLHPDLQPPAYPVLAHIATDGPLRASELAEVFSLDKGAISRHVQHLTELGLVTRVPDPADGRASLISATDDAVARLEDLTQHRRAWVKERLGDWDEAELHGLADVLGRYNETLS